MQRTISVSAPGKLMLYGEHAVVYGHPCIVTAVDQRLHLTVSQSATRRELSVDAPDVAVTGYKKPLEELGKGVIPKGVRFVEYAVKNFIDSGRVLRSRIAGLHIITKSEFASTFGFGSSSASAVCAVKALSEVLEIHLSSKEIFEISYKTVLDVQGKGSGFDVASAVYGGTLYFVTGGKIISPLAISHLPLAIGYSGVKADTVTLINKVAALSKENPELVNTIYTAIAEIVEKAKWAFEKEDFEEVGRLMNENQALLSKLEVSTEKLDAMIMGARGAGAFGAKISGAGGGDCMIALHDAQGKPAIENAIEKAGGEVIDVSTNAEGVRVE